MFNPYNHTYPMDRLTRLKNKTVGLNKQQLLVIECQPRRTTPSVKFKKAFPFSSKARRIRTKKSNHSHQSSISVPGLEKVCSSPHRWSKVLWLCALLGFYTLFAYQLMDRINAYLEHPVTLVVGVQKQNSVQFPSITVCPFPQSKIVGIISFLCKKVPRNYGRLGKCNIQKHLHTTLEHIWKVYGIHPDFIIANTSCIRKNSSDVCHAASESLEVKEFFSLYGTCTTLTLKNKMNYRGAQTFFNLEISKSKYKETHPKTMSQHEEEGETVNTRLVKNFTEENILPESDILNETELYTDKPKSHGKKESGSSPTTEYDGANSENSHIDTSGKGQNKVSPKKRKVHSHHEHRQIFFSFRELLFTPHGINFIPEHQVFTLHHRVGTNLRCDANFHLKQLYLQNRKESPCASERVAVKCVADCISKHLRAYVGCKLPFMHGSSLPLCQTLDEVDEAMAETERAYTEHEGCNCPRQCRETLIEYNFDNYMAHSLNDSNFFFSLRFPNNNVEVIREKYTYNLSSLLSDVGGSLGFCVGLCLFSFVELIDWFAHRTARCCCKFWKRSERK